jgi:hypothetical protein
MTTAPRGPSSAGRAAPATWPAPAQGTRSRSSASSARGTRCRPGARQRAPARSPRSRPRRPARSAGHRRAPTEGSAGPSKSRTLPVRAFDCRGACDPGPGRLSTPASARPANALDRASEPTTTTVAVIGEQGQGHGPSDALDPRPLQGHTSSAGRAAQLRARRHRRAAPTTRPSSTATAPEHLDEVPAHGARTHAHWCGQDACARIAQ